MKYRCYTQSLSVILSYFIITWNTQNCHDKVPHTQLTDILQSALH